MNEIMFSVASLAAIAAWIGLSLAAATRDGSLQRLLLLTTGRVVPVVLGLLYVYLLITNWGSAPEGGFGDLSSVLKLFSLPGNMLGGWVHFLTFDLLVGRWIVDDTLSSARSRVPLFLVLPATFMYGPLGFLLHIVLRWTFRNTRLDVVH